MEFSDDIKDSHASRTRGSKDNLLAAKIAELEKMKEDLKQAKDDAMQSWLDSRPVTDELEKKQAELESVKNRVSEANITISELQAQIGTTDMCIKSSKEEEQKHRAIINDENQALYTTQEEMEQLKMKIDKKRRRRSKLKLVLRLKRQTLQTLELTYEAIRLESEAFTTSAAQALSYINNTEAANIMVQITQEEYEHLKREASEQTSLAEWRISVSAEEKQAAENSRDSTFRRLQHLYPQNGPRQRNMTEETIRNEIAMKKNGGQENIRGGSQINNRHFSKGAQANSPRGVNRRKTQQQFKTNNYLVRKNKSSIFLRIKKFLVRKMSKYFK